jgi:hypothetical protein
MKTLLKTWLAAALLGFTSGVLASATIELNDGGRIQGEIQSFENGVYTIVSTSIGTVHVAQSKIARIVYDGDVSNAAAASGKAAPRNTDMSRDIEQMTARLAQDPAAVQSIMNLQSDPQIQAVLNDPTVAKAIQEGDYMSLLGNPKIQALESNEHLRQLIQQQVH